MKSSTDFVEPPRIAVRLVTLFVPDEPAESILGDLSEEFSGLASKSGISFARNWYWRQTVKTIAHLALGGFRLSPWSTVAAVAAGFLLLRFAFRFYGQAVEAILDHYQVYRYLSSLGSQQPSLNIAADYMFWITRGMLIGRVLVAALVGSIVAVAAKQREMAATMTLGLLLSALGVAGSLLAVASTGDYEFLFLWALPSVFADSIAVVVGGAIVRTRRLAAIPRPSSA